MKHVSLDIDENLRANLRAVVRLIMLSSVLPKCLCVIRIEVVHLDCCLYLSDMYFNIDEHGSEAQVLCLGQ